jgi:hypothetical protein
LEIERFNQGDNPVEEHRRKSPDCRLAAGVSNQFSLPSLSVLSEPNSENNSIMLAIYKSAVKRCSGQVQTNEPVESVVLDHRNDVTHSNISANIRIDRENPDFELLRHEQLRLNTFHDWPSTEIVIAEELAREGFFYTGENDRVRCAFCRNGLRSWEWGDIPREEHRKYYPNCPFVQNLDVANVRIEDETNLENFPQDLLSNPGPLPTSTGEAASGCAGVATGTGLSADTFMSTPAVRAVLEMGFPSQEVKQIVQQQLNDTGNTVIL